MTKELIVRKVEELSGTLLNEEINPNTKDFSQYISDKAGLRVVSYFAPLILDDTSLYIEALEEIEPSMKIQAILILICKYIWKKFGIIPNERRRLQIYDQASLNWEEEEKVSISEFVNESAAMCLEKAAFAHNLLKILDIDSRLYVGKLRVKGNDESGDLHVFNIVYSGNEIYLYDCSNFFKYCKQDGKKVPIPLISEISEEEMDSFKSSGHYVVTSKNLYNTNKLKLVEDLTLEYMI